MPNLRFRGPFRGINTAYDSSFNPMTDAEDCRNLVLGAGTIKRRDGWDDRLSFPDEGSPRGGFDYIKNDGTILTLFKIGGKLYAIQTSGTSWSSTLLATDGVAGENLVDFAAVNNRVYFADGDTFKVTDGLSVFDAEIARPAAGPNMSINNTGELTGSYEYRYTYYSSTWGQESTASSTAFDIVLNQDSADLTLASTSDTRVDKFRIYRRRTDTNEQLWYFAKESTHTPGAGTVVVNDNTADIQVDKNTIAPVASVAVSPVPSFMAYQADVLFMAGNPAAPNLLYYTPPGQPWAIIGSLPIGSSGDADPITGLASFQGLTVVFKKKSIWTVSGNDEDTFFVRKIISGVGATGHQTIVPVGDLIYFMGEDDFYFFDGAKAVPISRPVHDRVVNRNFSRDAWAVGCHLYDLGAILWTFADTGQTSSQKQLVYFYRYSEEVEFPVWSPWSFTLPLAYPLLVTDGTTQKRIPVFAFDTSGVLGAHTGSTDGDDVIDWFWRTGKIDAGSPDRHKIWRELRARFIRQTVGSLVDIRYILDDNPTANLTIGHDQSVPVYRRSLRQSSSLLRLEFGASNVFRSELASWDLEFETGRAA